ncbi:MAG: hypothetical protein U5N10_18975 [Gemmobacter sp.]|nr:hypothetical protein [Gemmobacter sp.]
MTFKPRMKAAGKAAFFHFLGSVLVACFAAVLVFLLWYPHPYGQLSGGSKLFAILIVVDVVCGPLLTLVLFSPRKSRREFFVDMSLVVLIQVAALSYGLYTMYQARPLFLVHEVDRFRVIGMPDYGDANVSDELDALPAPLKPSFFFQAYRRRNSRGREQKRASGRYGRVGIRWPRLRATARVLCGL